MGRGRAGQRRGGGVGRRKARIPRLVVVVVVVVLLLLLLLLLVLVPSSSANDARQLSVSTKSPRAGEGAGEREGFMTAAAGATYVTAATSAGAGAAFSAGASAPGRISGSTTDEEDNGMGGSI